MCETLGTDWEATAKQAISDKLKAWKAIERVYELAERFITTDATLHWAGIAILEALDGDQ